MTFQVIHKYSFEQEIKSSEFDSNSKTLSEIIKDLGYFSEFAAVVFIDEDKKAGARIENKFWDYIKPKQGTYLIIQAPAGGDVGQILLMVVSIAAIAWGQPWLAGVIEGMGASAAVAGAVAGGVIGVGLGVLATAIVPYEAPPPIFSSPASSPTLNISGSQNQVRAGAPVPYHVGTNRFVPPLAAQPVRESNGKDIYLNQVFIVGHSPVIISDLEIGDTPIENFSDVQIQINDGHSSNTQITTIKGDVTIQSGLSINMQYNVPQILTGGEFTEKASIVFAMNRGLVSIQDNGSYELNVITIRIEYRAVGAPSWILFERQNPDFFEDRDGTVRFKDSTVEQTFRTIDIPNLAKDQYEFRITQLSGNSTSSRVKDELTIVTLKTTQLTDDNGDALHVFPDGFAYIGIRIKASDQLSGNISQLSCKVQSVPEVWNGSSFVRDASQTGNPSWEYLTLIRSSAAKKTVSTNNIDTDQFTAWADRCNTLVNGKPRHRINHVVDYAGRQSDVMAKISSIGRAIRTEIDGTKSIVLDVGGRPAIQKFTNSNSFGFSASKSFVKKPDMFRCKFVNPAKGWTVDYVSIRRDDNEDEQSTDISEDLDCTGITDLDELYRYAKFAHAQIELRPEIYTLSTGVESLFSTMGDVVVISHDKIQGAVTSSRVSSTSGNDIILDSTIDIDLSEDYFVSFRHSQSAQNSSIYPVVIVGNTVTLSVTAASTNALAGDIVIIGTAEESVDRKYIIKEVTNSEDFNATLTLVDYADPDIYNSESGTIVNYNPGVFKQSINKFSSPFPPSILDIITDERALSVHGDGSFSARISVEIQGDDTDDRVMPEFIEISYRPTGSDGYFKSEAYSSEQTLIYANDVFEGSTYDIRVRYITELGIPSALALQNSVFVTGKATPPDDVENFAIENNAGNVTLTWDANDDIDLAGYVVKFTSALIGATWASSSVISGQLGKSVTQVSLPSRIGSYLIKAIDSSGRESISEKITTNNIQSIIGFNLVETLIEEPGFAGTKTGCKVVGGELRLTSDSVLNDWLTLDSVTTLDFGVGPIATSGVYMFNNEVDLGGVFDSRLSVDMIASGFGFGQTLSQWVTLDSVDVLDNVSPDQWGVVIQFRSTEDDPVSNNWSDWKELKIGEIKARGYQFRVLLSSSDTAVTPLVSRLRVIIDMPDRIESGDNISAAIGGTIVTYDNGAFNAVPAVVINGENLDTGDYHRVTGKNTEEFTINFFNSSNASISRDFDFVASGYGFQQ